MIDYYIFMNKRYLWWGGKTEEKRDELRKLTLSKKLNDKIGKRESKLLPSKIKKS